MGDSLIRDSVITPGSGAAGISWPRDAASFATSEFTSSQLCSSWPQSHGADGGVQIHCPACVPLGDAGGEALCYLLACPCRRVFKHRCLLLLTPSDKWRHFFHWKESQEFPCSLFILFFSPFASCKEPVTGRGWRRLARGRGEVALI